MAQGTILVVDDSPLATKIMSTLFTREGYNVLTAGSGEEALEQLGRVTPDLVVTDIMMPGIDGYELCHQIRVRPQLRAVPVLAITTITELEAKLRGFEVGVDDFVPSPAKLRRRGRCHRRADERSRHIATTPVPLPQNKKSLLNLPAEEA